MPPRGKILGLEHLNINTDSPLETFTFYIDGLGFVQDSRLGTLIDGKVYITTSMWLTAGINQLHIPITSRGCSGAERNVVRGVIGLAYEDIEVLCSRLESVETALAGTHFRWSSRDKSTVDICGPDGNHFVAHQQPASARDTRGFYPGPPSLCLGFQYVELDCPAGAAPAIAAYYEHYFEAAVEVRQQGAGTDSAQTAVILTGDATHCTELRYSERADYACTPEEPYAVATYGIHIALNLLDCDFVSAMRRMADDNLLWGNPRFGQLDRSLGSSQFRCKDVVDVRQRHEGRLPLVMEIEHEIRIPWHESSPWLASEHYTIPGREPVPRLVTSVTNEFEKDWEAVRAEKNAATEGYVPSPPTETDTIKSEDVRSNWFKTYEKRENTVASKTESTKPDCVDGRAEVGCQLPSLPGVHLEARGVTLVVIGGADRATSVEPAFRAACDRIGLPCRTCSVDGTEPAVATAFGDHRLAICRADSVVTYLGAASLPEGIMDVDRGSAAEALLLDRAHHFYWNPLSPQLTNAWPKAPADEAELRPRLNCADPASLLPEQRDVLQRLAGPPRYLKPLPDGQLPGPFVAYCYSSPEFATAAEAMGAAAKNQVSLPKNLLEIALLAVGTFWKCQFQFAAHARLAERAGVILHVIEGIRKDLPPDHIAFESAEEKAVYVFVRECLHTKRVGEFTYASCLEAVGSEKALVDLTMAVGHYGNVCALLNVFQVSHPILGGMETPFPTQRE